MKIRSPLLLQTGTSAASRLTNDGSQIACDQVRS